MMIEGGFFFFEQPWAIVLLLGTFRLDITAVDQLCTAWCSGKDGTYSARIMRFWVMKRVFSHGVSHILFR